MKAFINKFGNNPFEIAHQKNILIVAEPLGNIHGYYSDMLGQKIIHVNDSLNPLIMDYVTSYLLIGNEYLKGFASRFFIQKSFNLWTPIERKAHQMTQRLMKHNCNTVLERLTYDEMLEITTMLDRVWYKDTLYSEKDVLGKLEYVLSKFL